MADKKISALTSATTPLAGTEVLPIVQSGSTVKVAVSDLTAGRAVSALSFAGPLNGTVGATTATTGAFTTVSATGEFTNSTALTGTTIASNRIATFTSLASGRDANISLGDNVNASIRLGYLSGDFYITTSSIERFRVGVGGGVAVTGTLSATGTLSGGTSGTGYSFSGSAPANSLALNSSGNLGIGTSSPAAKFEVSTGAGTKMRLTSTADNNADIDFYTNSVYRGIIEFNSVGGLIYTIPSLPLTFGTNNTERARIDSSGNLIQTVNTTAATLATNGTLTFSIVNNSTLRISVRGSDGTTRTATVALT